MTLYTVLVTDNFGDNARVSVFDTLDAARFHLMKCLRDKLAVADDWARDEVSRDEDNWWIPDRAEGRILEAELNKGY